MTAARRLLGRVRDALARRQAPVAEPLTLAPPDTVLRIHSELWQQCEEHIRDTTDGEQAGVLLVRAHPPPDGAAGALVLTAVGFVAVDERFVTDRAHGLSYDGRFHLHCARLAEERSAGMLLVHAHGDDPAPTPSSRDMAYGAQFLAFASRRLPGRAAGLAVVGEGAVACTVVLNGTEHRLNRIAVVGMSRSDWRGLPWERGVWRPSGAARPDVSAAEPNPPGTDGPDRQELAFGGRSVSILAGRTVGVVGLSGGGSHVQQQLIHAGVGRLVVNDSELVSSTNLRRLVGAVATDVDRTLKTGVARRTAAAVRPEVDVVPVDQPFPSAGARAALRHGDLIVGCVDDWATRDSLNSFCLEHRIPYIDIGAAVTPTNQGPRVSGQVAVVQPGGPCLRDMGLVTDARVDAARCQAQGYLPNEPQPQVVSINGTLASEAVTAALLLLTTAHTPVAARRRYAYPPGKLSVVDAAADPGCPSCSRHGLR